MRNPLKRRALRDTSKPTLRERAAALRDTAARVMRRKPALCSGTSDSAHGAIEARSVVKLPSVADLLPDAILKTWALHASLRGDESPEGKVAFERVAKRKDEVIAAAERMPVTRKSLLAKSLALAWIEAESVDFWMRGQPRAEYAVDGRLALDIYTIATGVAPPETRLDPAQVGHAAAVSPDLVVMLNAWQRLGREINAPGSDDAALDDLSRRHVGLQTAIARFPCRSLADLHAKIPVFEDEAASTVSGLSDGYDAADTLPGSVWSGLIRDIGRLNLISSQPVVRRPAADAPPDPVLAAIAASRAAEAEMVAFGKRTAGRRATKAVFAEEDRLCALQKASRDVALSTLPTTRLGQLALLKYIRFIADLYDMTGNQETDEGWHMWVQTHGALMAALAAPVAGCREAADPGLSDIPTRLLGNLYETVTCLWLRASAEVEAPWCWEAGAHNHNAAGNFLEAEAERQSGLLDAIVAEARSREPVDDADRNRRLTLLLRHELQCGERVEDRALLAEAVAAWGA